MKRAICMIMSLLFMISSACPAGAEFGKYKGDKYTYYGGLEDGMPSGLGVKVYKGGAYSVGVFDPRWGYAYGFTITIDPKSDVFYYHLSAGFRANSFSMQMMDKTDYEDKNDKRICYTQSDARGLDQRVLAKKKYDDGTVYYGETQDGEPSGYGLYRYADGSYLGGLTVDGAINGWGILVEADGTGFMGEYANGALDGYAYYFDENGDAYLCVYRQNEFVETLNDEKPLSRDQTSLPPEILALDLNAPGLAASGGSSGLDDTGRSSSDKMCSRCGGTGKVTCSRCGGKGYVYSTYHVNADGTTERMRLNCSNCMFGQEKCPKCHGSGKE